MARFATKEDIPAVNQLRKQVNELHVSSHPDFFRPGFGPELRDAVLAMIGDEDKDVIVAERTGLIRGMACIEYVQKEENAYHFAVRYCCISELCVNAGYYRQGIATELMSFIGKAAAAHGCPCIRLKVYSFNRKAADCYRALGFQTIEQIMELKTIKQ